MKKLSNISKKNNITFGILFFILFLIIGTYPLISGAIVRTWSISLSIIILIITIIKPNLFTFLNRFWIQFGILLGKIISAIIMFLVFFLVVTPTGILIRLFKKDVMGLKIKSSSYWINRENKLQSFKKQF